MVNNYWFQWLEVLQEKRSSYGCTDPSLELDLSVIQRDFETTGHQLSPTFIIFSTIGLMLLTLGHFCCHYQMMMRWYEEHPIDGNAVARSIRVGLPADGEVGDDRDEVDGEMATPRLDAPELGHAVPEADREVKKEPLSV